MEIAVTAPNRIDLAGGTTDLFPLYLFMDGGCTVNAAITLGSRAVFRTRDDGRLMIASEDLGETAEAAGPDGLPLDGPLGLVGRAVRAVPPPVGIEIVTRNEAPTGSGLGASSALLVALLSGLLKLRGEDLTPAELIGLSANIEAAAIGVPAGTQDHIAAVYGGLSLIHFGYRGHVRRPLGLGPVSHQRLEEMIVLSYTGQGRFSGMNNWDVTKGFIDDRDSIREKLVGIRDVALDVCAALSAGQWAALPGLVDREWALRRSLAPGVSTPQIDQIAAAAATAGASANKVCGAGGGGCMITFVEPKKRDAVEKAVASEGGQIIPFKIDTDGLKVEVRRTNTPCGHSRFMLERPVG